MTTYLTILETQAGMPATKSFVRDEYGATVKLPMRMSKYFTVERRVVETIYDLAATLTDLNSSPRKLVIRGEPTFEIDPSQYVRRLKYVDGMTGATFRSAPNGEAWICFDFDKIDCPDGIFPARDFENAMIYLSDMLPAEFHDVTFWAQLSSSSGIKGWGTVSAHLWFMLDRPINDDDLNEWAKIIEAPIDARLFNAVQPHFTAAPIFAYDVTDPCPVRHGLIKGTRDVVTLDLSKANVGEGITDNSCHTETDSERTRPTARPDRTTPGSRNSQMGIGSRNNQWANSNSGAIILERPLLSEWLTNCFHPKPS